MLVFERPTDIRHQWAGLQCFIAAQRNVRHKNKITEDTAYFISSLSAATPAAVFGTGIRGHWGIEAMHYTKDVTFRKDASKTRTKQAPENSSLIRNIAINLFRGAGHTNIAQAIRLVAHDIPKLWEMVSA